MRDDDDSGDTIVVINQRSGCVSAMGFGCAAVVGFCGICVLGVVFLIIPAFRSANEAARRAEQHARAAAAPPAAPATPATPDMAPKEATPEPAPKEPGRILQVPDGIETLSERPRIVAPAVPEPPTATPEPDGPRVGDTVVLSRPGDLAQVYMATDLAAFAAMTDYHARGIEGPFRRLVRRKAILRVQNGTRATVQKVRPNGLYVSFKDGKKIVQGWVPTDHAVVQGR